MAFAETDGLDRIIVQGVSPVEITLAGAVDAGDPLMYSTGWVLSASTGTEPTLLFAAVKAVSGEVIKAYPLAEIQVTNTAGNVGTVGELVAVADDGTYAAAAANTQNVGFVTAIDTVASLWTRICVCGMAASLTVVRA
jgi:hypothetical protein